MKPSVPAGNVSKIGGAVALRLHSGSTERAGIKVIETINFVNLYAFISKSFEDLYFKNCR